MLNPKILLLLFVFFVQKSPAQTHYNYNDGLALEGYDALSYFQKKPTKGLDKYSYTYQGLKYSFASSQNLELFRQNPNRYLPQYGGWCAYAMGYNAERVEVHPLSYKIVQGKLYLFYKSFFNNTLEKWNKNENLLRQQADTNWQKQIAKKQ
jgi:YHS domain-containing protein